MIKSYSSKRISEILGPVETQYGVGPTPDADCDGLVTAGQDTPVTEIIEMGQSSGTFAFEYETYSQQDQMIVRYEGNILFDTGCVGANGTEMLNYAGSSTQVSVEVIPNCAGGAGTAWEFTVRCPTN